MSAKTEGQHVSGSLQDELALPHSFFTRPQDSLAHPYKPTTSPYLALYTKMIAHLGLGGPIQTVSEVMILSISPNLSNSLLFVVNQINMMIFHRLTREMIASSNSQAARGVSTEGGDEMINCSQDY